ncbi:hypothetical protein ACF06Q_26100 [Streptomyces leeuwenhoekii]|uniref:hypothetical protein n=1 Tax=Streptomyces leeuwenhoekii TaxID=1437453 RepID=UPI0036F5AA5E
MTSSSPRNADLSWHEGWTPGLPAGTYRIDVEHTVKGDRDVSGTFDGKQSFTVAGRRFSLEPDLVRAACPAAGAHGDFRTVLPHVVLHQAHLPWERRLGPTAGSDCPWMALLVTRDGELPRNADTGRATTERPVADLLSGRGDDGVLLPDLAKEDGVPIGPATCLTLDVPAAAFTALTPRLAELPYLVHAQRAPGARPGTYDDTAVVLANRLPREAGPYSTYLVSLEGFAGHLGGTLPAEVKGKPLTAVRLVVLWSASFTVTTTRAGSFTTTAETVAENTRACPTLRLPVPDVSNRPAPEAVAVRLRRGYVPVLHRLPTGTVSYAWYRGPLTPVRAAPVPEDPEPCDEASVTIYRRREGVFDISYAAAFALGRTVALSSPELTRTLLSVHARTVECAQMLARTGFPDGGGQPPAAAHREFEALLRGATVPTGPGAAAAHAAAAPDTAEGARVCAYLAESCRDELARAGLTPGRLLEQVPFDYLVPSAGMLPRDSARFFHLDRGWLEVMAYGAADLGVRTRLDARVLHRAVAVLADDTLPAAGMLLRSALVRDWPGLGVEATDGEGENVLAKAGPPRLLAPDLLLVCFDRPPVRVRLTQPSQTPHFGLDGESRGGHLKLRYLQAPDTGGTIPDKYFDAVFTRHLRTGAYPGVLNLCATSVRRQSLTAALRDRLAAEDCRQWDDQAPLTSSALALQLLNTPGQLTFAPARHLAPADGDGHEAGTP